jgi:hypothetical protein
MLVGSLPGTDGGFRLCRGAAEAILLGFQHYLVMLGTTVIIPTALVPQMGGGNVRPSLSLSSCFVVLPPLLHRRSLTRKHAPFPGTAGGEGAGDPDAAVRRRHQHAAPELPRHAPPRRHRGLIHLRRAHHLHHPRRPLQRHCRSPRGMSAVEALTFVAVSLTNLVGCVLSKNLVGCGCRNSCASCGGRRARS